MTRIEGKVVSASVREALKSEVENLSREYGRTPGLAVILVGEDPASQVYVRNKARACEELGIYSEVYRLPKETEEDELLSLIDKLNADDKIHGILCQLPLPRHISEEKVIQRISPRKDVDAFHPENVGHIMEGKYSFLPCTPAGVMELLSFYGISVEGKECCVIGRSNIVGKPMSMLLLNASGTVTVCHSRTKNLPEVVRRADIVVVAVGRAKFLTADMVKDGAVVIDVGINRGEDGKLYGDADYEALCDKVSFITPVPGGVGPMTITMLMKNTLTAFKKIENIK